MDCNKIIVKEKKNIFTIEMLNTIMLFSQKNMLKFILQSVLIYDFTTKYLMFEEKKELDSNCLVLKNFKQKQHRHSVILNYTKRQKFQSKTHQNVCPHFVMCAADIISKQIGLKQMEYVFITHPILAYIKIIK